MFGIYQLILDFLILIFHLQLKQKFQYSIPDHVKIDVTQESENVMGITEKLVVDVEIEVNDSSLIGQTLEKDDDISISGPRKSLSHKVNPASGKKPTKATLKNKVNIDRSQKSNKVPKVRMKPKTIESKVKKTEKRLPRPATHLPCPGVKSSKPEVSVNFLEL